MTKPVEVTETLAKQEPRVTIDRKESVKGGVSWNIGISAPLSEGFTGLIDRVAEARKLAYKKDAEIRRYYDRLEGLQPKKGDFIK